MLPPPFGSSSCCCLAGLEKDIGGLKREIRERDETIGDKERRIYELKKKNQELEKFKFVLDYKIKELKKQVRCSRGAQGYCYSRRRSKGSVGAIHS